MNIILFFDRIKEKIEQKHKKYIFKKQIGCKHSDFFSCGRYYTYQQKY